MEFLCVDFEVIEFGINREDREVLHIVTIEPDRLQRNIVSFVSSHNVFDFVEAAPSIASYVPAHGPEWWELWQANEVLILRNDVLGRASEEEVDVEVSAGRNVTQNMLVVLVLDDWSLCVCASEENAEELIRRIGFNEAERMHSCELLSSVATVEFSLSILRPHGPCAWSQFKVGFSLTKTVDMSTWDFHVNLDELLLVNKSLLIGVNQHLTSPCACKREAERILLVLEVNHIESELILTRLL